MKREEMALKAICTSARDGFDLSVTVGVLTTKGRMPRDPGYLQKLEAAVLKAQKNYEMAVGLLRSVGKSPKELGAEAVETVACEWEFNEADGCWDTSCGGKFNIDHGTPTENEMHFCPYCGKILNEKGGM